MSNLSRLLMNFKDNLFDSKKYWALYIILVICLSLTIITRNNIIHPKFEIITFLFLIFLGIFCIVYKYAHNSDDELYKIAFVTILCFGIICSLIVPICDVSDENEHFNRAEITSNGIIFPHWSGDDIGVDRLYNITTGEISNLSNHVGFESIGSIYFFYDNIGLTVFETDHDTDKINFSEVSTSSAFQQNPFYGYLPQSIGILIAKLLDLNVIWMLWLGRIFNLLCYAILVSYSIKKTPHLKHPLLAISCIPLTIYQAASVSIDSLVFGLSMVVISYFIYFYSSNSIQSKEILIFSFICLLLGLCKLPYLAFIFLLLLIPKKNFNNESYVMPLLLSCIIFVAISGVIYSHFASPLLMHSWRSQYNLVNSTQQLTFLVNNPFNVFLFLQQIFTEDIVYLSKGFFTFYNGNGNHYENTFYMVNFAIMIFINLIVLFIYPKDIKFDLKTKIGTLIVILIVYVGTCFIQLLTWSKVGNINLGISLRYFIPLLMLFPIVIQLDNTYNKEKWDNYIFIMIITFLTLLIFSFAINYY